MKTFVTRYPLIFTGLLTLALLGFAYGSRALRPGARVGSVRDLPAETLGQPTEVERAFAFLLSFESLFWVLAALIAILLARSLGSWNETGFNRPASWRAWPLLVPPLLVGVLALLDGTRLGSAPYLAATLLVVLVAAFAEETLYRGVAWHGLILKGPVRAAVAAAFFAAALRFGGTSLGGPWPEAVQAAALAFCGGFVYAGLRWISGSLWFAILPHAALNCAFALYSPDGLLFLALLLLSTLAFVAYGLLLLRRPPIQPAR